MKGLYRVLILVAVVGCLASCYKSTVSYTRFNLAVYEQTESGSDSKRARLVKSYAYYVDTAEWHIASYADAIEARITNKLTGEVRTQPDVWGELNTSYEYQVSLILTEPLSLMVVVDEPLGLYAFRQYELPENLPSVSAKLYLTPWRGASQTSSGWTVINEFYKKPSSKAPIKPCVDDKE